MRIRDLISDVCSSDLLRHPHRDRAGLMNWFTGVLVYCMVWVVVLLTVLPWGVRAPDAPTAGHEPGAPEQPMLPKKFHITTLTAALIWGIIYVVIDQKRMSFRVNADHLLKPGFCHFPRPPSIHH